MGSIQTSIQLYDGASSVLSNISNAVSRTTQRFDDMNDHFDDAFDEGGFNSAKSGFNTINILINKIENNIDRSTTTQQAFTQQVNKSTQAESEMLSRLKQVESTVNKLDDGIRQANSQQQSLNASLNAGNSAGGNLLGKIKSMVTAYLGLRAAGNVLDTSDTLTQTTARLSMMNDGLQTTNQLQNMIFESAERSRASYTNTASVISKLGINAKDAFSNNQETIQFAENLNKMFVIAGSSQAEMSSASLQLTQALGSGVLRGEELNAVFEAAPNVIQTIADSLGVSIGQIRALASDGKITASIVKNALLGATNDINKQFEAMPMTFAQIWTGIKNDALIAFEPILTKLNEIANSKKFQIFVNNLISGLQSISIIAMGVFDAIVNIVNFFSDNWSMIAPVIYGIAAALSVYYGWLLLTTAAEGALTLAKTLAVPIYALLTGATMAETAAQWGLNSALYACPIVWIIILIIALIAIFYAAVAAINHFAGTSYSATGIIAGAFLTAFAFIGNVVIGTINAMIQFIWARFVEPFISIIEWVLNVANGGFDSFGDAVSNLIGQVISWFLSLGKVVTKIIDAIFGTNWTAGLSSLQNEVISWGKNDNAITLDHNAPGIDYRFNYGDAWGNGNKFGASIDGSIENLLNSSKDDDNDKNRIDTSASDAYKNIATTADNTSKMADSVNISDEDLKYLHDVAERETINRFTTAEIKVDMTNHNTVNGTQDLDGIVDYLRNAVEEQMSVSAEGA
jgi:tape measure domain-containing protein